MKRFITKNHRIRAPFSCCVFKIVSFLHFMFTLCLKVGEYSMFFESGKNMREFVAYVHVYLTMKHDMSLVSALSELITV